MAGEGAGERGAPLSSSCAGAEKLDSSPARCRPLRAHEPPAAASEEIAARVPLETALDVIATASGTQRGVRSTAALLEQWGPFEQAGERATVDEIRETSTAPPLATEFLVAVFPDSHGREVEGTLERELVRATAPRVGCLDPVRSGTSRARAPRGEESMARLQVGVKRLLNGHREGNRRATGFAGVDGYGPARKAERSRDEARGSRWRSTVAKRARCRPPCGGGTGGERVAGRENAGYASPERSRA